MEKIQEALKVLQEGGMVLVTDAMDRENEGDLIMAAEHISPQAVNFMTQYGRGLICVPMTGEALDRLEIGLMQGGPMADPKGTKFTWSVDHVSCHTGISAYERADTILALAKDTSLATDFTSPGHMFPLRAADGLLGEREGHTEAALYLMELAGLKKVAVICEVLNEDGTMARLMDLEAFSRDHAMPLISIEELKAYGRAEIIAKAKARAVLPTKYGDFEMIGYEENGKEHVVLKMGQVDENKPFLVRVHSSCLTGDALGSLRCDCGDQYDEAMKRIAEAGAGVLVYMDQEGRGIGLLSKIKAYGLQDEGLDTVDANIALGYEEDERRYDYAAAILKDLGIHTCRLLTNNPDKVYGLEKAGIRVMGQIPLWTERHEHNHHYLTTKIIRMGHIG